MQTLLYLNQLALHKDKTSSDNQSPTLNIIESNNIKEMLHGITQADSHSRIRAFFYQLKRSGVPLIAVDPSSYFIDGHHIELSISSLTSPENRTLQLVQSLNINSAPTIILHKVFKNKESVKITYYRASKKHLPKVYLGNIIDIPLSTREKLALDLLRLADANFYHSLVLRDQSHWLLSDDKELIYLSAWHRLRRISSMERIDLSKNIQDKILNCV